MVHTMFSSLMTMAFASEGDLTSLLQVSARVRHSRGQRLLAAVAKEGSTICVEAVAGDVAPLAGSFVAEMGHEAVEVAAGSVAEQAGSFCVPKPDVLLMQRTFGLNTARDFEAALGAKKRQHTTTTTTVDFHHFNFAEDVKKEVVVKQCPDKKAGLLQTMDATVAHKRRGRSPAQKEREADEKRVCECRSFLESSVGKMWNEKVFNIVDEKQNAQLLQRNFDAALATKKRRRTTTTTTTTTTEQLIVVEGMTTACMKASELEVGVFGAYGMVDSSQLPSWGVVAKLINDPDIAALFKEANITEGWQHCDQSWVVQGACGKFLHQQKPNNKPNYNDVGYPDMGNEAAIVGDGGLVLRYVGDSWVRQDYGPQCQNCLEKKGDLLGVGFPDEGKGVRAVGKNGLWLEFKPSDDGITGTWEQEVQWVGLSDAEKTTLNGIDLHAVQFPDGGDEIMAVGTDGYVLRWLGAKWKLEQVGSGTLKAIAFPDEGDGYGCLVAGSDGEVYMQKGSNDAAKWEKQTVPAGPNGEVCDFEDIRYDQDQQVGAGYAIAAGSHGLVYQIKPTEMDEDLVPIAPTEITLLKQFDFTVYTMQYQGENHIKIAGAGGNIREFTGGEWTEPAASRKLTRQDIYRSFLSDQGDVVSFVGAKGTILRYSSGQFVNAEYEDHGTNLESVAFPDQGGEAIAVGHAGTILEVKNDIWKAVVGTGGFPAHHRHLKCVAFSGSNAMVVGMDGAWLQRRDGKWIGGGRRDDQNLNGCAFGKLPVGRSAVEHFVAVGEGGRILTQIDPFKWPHAGQMYSFTVGTCENDTPCDLNAVAFSDYKTKIAVGAGGKIWMQRGNRKEAAWEAVDSPTTKDLYAIAFKSDGTALEEAIIVGAEGTALVYGHPVADKWNLACKGILKGTPATCEAEGPWALITEDLKSVTYLDAENDDDPQKQIAIITGNKGTFVQYGFNAGNRNFEVMKENGSTDKNLNSIAVSNKGALVFVVGQGTDVDGEEPEATIIRKTGKEVWSDEKVWSATKVPKQK